MSPDRRARRSMSPSLQPRIQPVVRVARSSDDAHAVAYFQRHRDDDPTESAPGREFLKSCPAQVRVKMQARLVEVAAAPPKRFAGGGYWEAMKGDMAGWFEVRADGPKRHHYRLYCLLDYEAEGRPPLLVVVSGLDKPFRTVLSDADYKGVRILGEEYLGRNPRSLAN